MIGCGRKDSSKLYGYYPGNSPNTVGYYVRDGQKYKKGSAFAYGKSANLKDNITMAIDLRPYKYTVSYSLNGNDMGIAYSGLNDWEDIYIMVALSATNDKFKITQYEVTEEKKRHFLRDNIGEDVQTEETEYLEIKE